MALTASAAVPEEWFHRRADLPRPRWPAEPIDPSRVDVGYDAPADELTLFFWDKRVPWYSDQIDTPGSDHVALMVEEGTGRVVGIHSIPFLVGAVREHPAWVRLAWGALAGAYGEAMLREALPAFIADVADLVARYGADGPIDGLSP